MVTCRRREPDSPVPDVSVPSLLWLKRLLRSPTIIVGEVLAIAAAGVVSTAIPQATELSRVRHFGAAHPGWSSLTRALALDRVLTSAWFLGVLSLAALSLGIVLVDQWRRLGRTWPRALTEASFRAAPYRRELERPSSTGASARFRTTGRIGLLGSPLFHLGLMTIVIAGFAHWLFFADAVAELIEGETLDPGAWARMERWSGALARPFQLEAPLRVERLEPSRYASGPLRALAARVSIGGRTDPLAINAPLELEAGTLLIGSVHGPAAIVELEVDGRAERRALLLRETDAGDFGDAWLAPGGLQLLVRGEVGPDAGLPRQLELRVLRGGSLLYLGSLPVGLGVELAGGARVALLGVRYWAVFRGSRDPSRWVAWVGFLLVVIGGVLMFAVVRVDTAVIVTPTPSGERVLVALRADRFTALFAEKFERLVRAEEPVHRAGRSRG
jgi:hypothetical protein